MTDRPQFDVLANLRPAPERQPSEAEALRAEVAVLKEMVKSAFLLIDTVDGCQWRSQSNLWQGLAKSWCAKFQQADAGIWSHEAKSKVSP